MKLYLLILMTLTYPIILNAQNDFQIFDELQQNIWYLPTDDEQARLYVTQIGKGDTIITLHGGPGNDFHYLVDAVRNNAHKNTFVLFDQRGSLMSPVKDSLISSLSLDLLVDDLETLRKALNQEKVVLLGHSFGSLLAISYYLKYPQNVKGIILTATMPPYVNKVKPFSAVVKDIHSRIKVVRNRPEIQEIIKKEGLENDSLLTAQQKSDKSKIAGNAAINMVNIKNWRKFKGGGVYYNYLIDSAIASSIPETYDIRNVLDKFPVPISIIQGDQDYIDPAGENWKEIKEAYQLVKLFVVKSSSHYIWLDHQLEFDELMRQELDRIKSFGK